jgi:Type II CAAX prenyl endopeptidase Rce1-like
VPFASSSSPVPVAPATKAASYRTDALTDLAFLSPLFVIYHVGVVFLPIRNAADLVTVRLVALAEQQRLGYLALTLALGAVGVLLLLGLGRRKTLHWTSFAAIAVEGIVYAMAMRLLAGAVTQWLSPLAMDPAATSLQLEGTFFPAVVMSCGAGLYEELMFRALFFHLGSEVILRMDDWRPWLVRLLWGLLSAAAFSAWHHVGALGEPFALRPFVFRTVCGLVFTLIYWFRGLSPAAWTHALYDAWVFF